MLRVTRKPEPLTSLAAGQGIGHSATVGNGRPPHSTTAIPVGTRRLAVPLAMKVQKDGRSVVVGKLTWQDGQVVFGIARKGQVGTTHAISVPVIVCEAAAGYRPVWLVVRNDNPPDMRRIRWDDFMRRGWLRTSHGLVERFILLSDMQPVPWQVWQYATEELLCTPATATDPGNRSRTGGGWNQGVLM